MDNSRASAETQSEEHSLGDSVAMKPSALLVLCSVLVIATSCLVISVAIAMFAATWDPCSLLGGVILLPVPVVLALQQYRAVFRANSRAASTSAVLLFGVGGSALLPFAAFVAQLLTMGVALPWLSLLIPMLLVGVIASLAAWLNFRWSRQLKDVATSQVDAMAPKQFSLREMLVAVTAIACMTALVTYFVESTPPRYAENVSRDEAPFALPVGARSVSFCWRVRGPRAYEFTIDEPAFVEWVDSGIGSFESEAAEIPLKPITTPYTITRCNALTRDLAGPDSITITNGLYYDWSKEDRGVYAAFDRTTNRAYYFAHSY